MEEVWKDINLATLNDQGSGRHSSMMSTRPDVEGVMFQDFLGRPIDIDDDGSPLPSNNMSISSARSLYCPASPAPPLVTLSLSSSHYPHRFNLLNPQTLASSASLLGTKRFPEPPLPSTAHCSTIGDRRNKRMIKNRESAARSRARKQAYTNELQLEVEHLKEENARLRRQHQQLSEVAASEQKKKGTLCRASTAPF